ncbi:MAG TPA: DNA methyltransferase, partial [Bacteroidales bacterium]|nr:DNA methyltransferase [Bacteroidales bacterium]
MKSIKILWADDEIELLKPHIIFLESKGYSVTPVHDGANAIEKVSEEHFDIVFLDEQMPGISGIDALSQIKQISPDIPVIMITKSEAEDIMEAAIGSKISDYLIKPVNPNQILLTLKKNLESKHLITQETTSKYQIEFSQLGIEISNAHTWEEWIEVYKKISFWELQLEQSKDRGMDEVLHMQKLEANLSFAKYIQRNYLSWFANTSEAPILSQTLIKNRVFNTISPKQKTMLLVIDNLRYDHWLAIRPLLKDLYTIDVDSLYFSILPTTTQYARNALFSGLMPSEIAKLYPDIWKNDDDDEGKNKYEEQVQTVYIDPPFNKEQDANYLYSVKYKDSSWATLLENRLRLTKDWLNEKGSIFVRCDYNGNWIVRCLMDSEFGKENFRNEIAITRTKTALYIATPQKLTKNLGVSYDNIFWFSKLPETNYLKISDGVIWTKRESYWKDYKSFYDRPSNRYTLLGITPQPGCSWVWKKEESLKAVENYEEYLRISAQTGESLEEYWEKIRGKLKFLRKEGNTIKYWVEPIQKVSINDWTILEGYARSWGFPTENSEKLLKIIIDFTSNECDLILDFFLGSGTTTAVAHKLGRKWLGVEMGEHFYSVVLPRMKKVLAYDKSGISKEVKEYQGGGFFKYYELEQYEETLANCKYEDSDLFNSPSET